MAEIPCSGEVSGCGSAQLAFWPQIATDGRAQPEWQTVCSECGVFRRELTKDVKISLRWRRGLTIATERIDIAAS